MIAESPSGKRLAYMPAIPAVDDSLLKRIEEVDLLLFDGTFWSDDELIRTAGFPKKPDGTPMGYRTAVKVGSAVGRAETSAQNDAIDVRAKVVTRCSLVGQRR